jgi:hypothetical protein
VSRLEGGQNIASGVILLRVFQRAHLHHAVSRPSRLGIRSVERRGVA